MPLAISDPSGYAWGIDSSQHVVYTDTGGNTQEFYSYRSAPSDWNQNNLTLSSATQGDGPAPPAAGDPSGYTWSGDLGQHVVYRGALDSHVHELYFGAGPREWLHFDLTAEAGGAPLAAGDPVGYGGQRLGDASAQRVVYLGVDSHVHQLSNRGFGWQEQDLTEAAGGATLAAGDPSPHLAIVPVPTAPPTVELAFGVAYRGADSRIHQLAELDGAWHEQDLTLTLAAGDPHGFNFHIGGMGEVEASAVVYRDVDSHIDLVGSTISVFGDPRGPLNTDLTDDFDAPLAAGDPVALERFPLAGFVVYYRGTDSHIYEIKSAFGSGSSGVTDLTEAAGGATLAAGDPTAYVFGSGFNTEPPGIVHVAYRGTDSHIYELSGTSSEGWRFTDLTETAAPLAQAEYAVIA